jgi:hypothetical protein
MSSAPACFLSVYNDPQITQITQITQIRKPEYES